MLIDIVATSNGAAVSGHTARRITAIDRANKTITISGAAMTASAFASGYSICVQGSYGKELTGLGAIFKSTGSLYGLSRSTYNWMVPYLKDITNNNATTSISDIIMQESIDKLDETAASQVDFIVCSFGVKRGYQVYFDTYRTNVDVMELGGGYKSISYNGIPVVSDRFVPANTMYLLNTKEFNLHQLCDWQWLEGEDGRVLKQNAGKPTYSATLVKYADIICDQPFGQARIVGITEA